MAEQPTTADTSPEQVNVPRSMRSKGLEWRCTVCKHPKLQQINRDLATGCSYRIAAERYGLSATAIQRHTVNHLPAALQAGMHSAVARENKSLAQYALAASDKRFEILQRQMDRLETLMTERGAAMQGEAPGAGTGLLVRKTKTIVHEDGEERYTEKIHEYEMDANIFKATKDICELASKESGHWAKVMGLGNGPAAGGTQIVLVMPGDSSQLELGEVRHGVSLAARTQRSLPHAPHVLASASMTDVPMEAEEVQANARQQTLSGQDEFEFDAEDDEEDVAP